ncbi:phosphoribosylformylglycinamidine cyclo-ligase [Paenibacillus ginsengarvi]|uniref:Phosphoribosylformylglycinamidine cyclo-ligase n=1 Tax=Paenibacillus ginsengarvi TaxID=400777 RepID=A0A3B0CI02_9BACL|nr:phosphoribosylformylglycinamidine cyclo-ligase [Paenibacillus ginsengarvi]RKN84670.1 phosphoribosylformylglycinamidine cyclo-ligase [Paenibacillus ginsengarvi]
MSEQNRLTYAGAGINIDDTDEVKQKMAKSLETNDGRVLNSLGAFASLFDFKFPEYEHPILVMKTEEPGSKQKLAVQHGRVRSVCYDMINHLINDIIVMGAKPLAVQDAIICGSVEKETIAEIVDAVAAACREQDCVLTGGETSIQPGVLEPGTFILTSSIVGVVDKANIVDGSAICKGDVIIAVASNGVHTNGYTLVRAIMDQSPGIMERPVVGESFLDAIMKPHLCYYKALRGLFGSRGLHGMAHITGGGIVGNLNRVIPDGLDASVDLSAIRVLPVFKLLREAGQVEEREMLRTFNLGVGMVLVVSPDTAEQTIEHLRANGMESYAIGEVTDGDKRVVYRNRLNWE